MMFDGKTRGGLALKAGLSLSLSALMLVGCAQQSANSKKSARTISHVPERYRVQPGDTVSAIAQRYGLNWREVSALNRLDANHTIRVGQWLMLDGLKSSYVTQQTPQTPTKTAVPQRVVGYTQVPAHQIPRTVTAPARPEFVPEAVLPPSAITTNRPTPVYSVPKTQPQPQIQPIIQPVKQPAQQAPSPYGALMSFVYPVGKANAVVRHFGMPIGQGVSEGMFFSGKAGDTIMASQAGVVTVYRSGEYERAMLIIEHDNGYRTTYFDIHNVVVAVGQRVKAGDKLGIMLAQTASGVALFEFRISQQGRYIDPVSVLR